MYCSPTCSGVIMAAPLAFTDAEPPHHEVPHVVNPHNDRPHGFIPAPAGLGLALQPRPARGQRRTRQRRPTRTPSKHHRAHPARTPYHHSARPGGLAPTGLCTATTLIAAWQCAAEGLV